MKTKTIIMNQEKFKGEGRGILSLTEGEEFLTCKLRVYKLDNINRFCKLGIFCDGEVFSGNLICKIGAYETTIVGNFDFEKDFYCALVDTSKGNQILLSGGTYGGMYFSFDESKIFSSIEKEKGESELFGQPITTSTVECAPNSANKKNFEDNDFECNKKCETCIYKQKFFETTSEEEKKIFDTNFKEDKSKNKDLDEVVDNKSFNLDENVKLESYSNQCNQVETKNLDMTKLEPDKTVDTKEEDYQKQLEAEKLSADFISSILPQFDYIFQSYPLDDVLIKLIDNSKFVKIEEAEESYSIGAIFEAEKIKYICYAVKRNYNQTPPKEIGENFQWLPIDSFDPLSDGYYVVFQDASDLKIVSI